MTFAASLSLGYSSNSRTKQTQSILPALIASSLTMVTFGMVQLPPNRQPAIDFATQQVIARPGLSKPQQAQVPSFDLLRHAVGQLENIAMRHPSLSSDVSSIRKLLPLVLADGFPTPQVGLSGDSQIEIRWLVGDDFLSVTSLGDGDFLAMHFIGDQLSEDMDFDQNDLTRSSDVVSFLRSRLTVMAVGVKKRIQLNR